MLLVSDKAGCLSCRAVFSAVSAAPRESVPKPISPANRMTANRSQSSQLTKRGIGCALLGASACIIWTRCLHLDVYGYLCPCSRLLTRRIYTMAHRTSQNVSKALAIAGKWASIFAVIFFLFLFSTILMVGGDGTAPSVTHLSVAIISFTVRLLGIGTSGAVFPVVLFWTLAVFVVVFLLAMILRRRDSESSRHTNDSV